MPPSDEQIKRWAEVQRLACEAVNRKARAEREALESLPDFGSLTESEHADAGKEQRAEESKKEGNL